MKIFEEVSLFFIVLLFAVFFITTIFVRITYEDVTNKMKKIDFKYKNFISSQ